MNVIELAIAVASDARAELVVVDILDGATKLRLALIQDRAPQLGVRLGQLVVQQRLTAGHRWIADQPQQLVLYA